MKQVHSKLVVSELTGRRKKRERVNTAEEGDCECRYFAKGH